MLLVFLLVAFLLSIVALLMNGADGLLLEGGAAAGFLLVVTEPLFAEGD